MQTVCELVCDQQPLNAESIYVSDQLGIKTNLNCGPAVSDDASAPEINCFRALFGMIFARAAIVTGESRIIQIGPE